MAFSFAERDVIDFTKTSLPRVKDYANAALLALSQLKIIKLHASQWENGAAFRTAIYRQKSEVEDFLFGLPGKIWVIKREEHPNSPNIVYLQWIQDGKETEFLTPESPYSIMVSETEEIPEVISFNQEKKNES